MMANSGPSPDPQQRPSQPQRHTDLIAITVLLLLLAGVSAVSEGLRLGREAMRPHLTEIGDELRRERDTWRKESHVWLKATGLQLHWQSAPAGQQAKAK